MNDKKKMVIIYDTGQVYQTPEEDIWDPPDPPDREKNLPYNEEEEQDN